MTETKRQIQAVADAKSISFEDVVKSMCESLQAACDDPDVIFRWTGEEFRGMRRIEDEVLMGVLSETLVERLDQWKKL